MGANDFVTEHSHTMVHMFGIMYLISMMTQDTCVSFLVLGIMHWGLYYVSSTFSVWKETVGICGWLLAMLFYYLHSKYYPYAMVKIGRMVTVDKNFAAPDMKPEARASEHRRIIGAFNAQSTVAICTIIGLAFMYNFSIVHRLDINPSVSHDEADGFMWFSLCISILMLVFSAIYAAYIITNGKEEAVTEAALGLSEESRVLEPAKAVEHAKWNDSAINMLSNLYFLGFLVLLAIGPYALQAILRSNGVPDWAQVMVTAVFIVVVYVAFYFITKRTNVDRDGTLSMYDVDPKSPGGVFIAPLTHLMARIKKDKQEKDEIIQSGFNYWFYTVMPTHLFVYLVAGTADAAQSAADSNISERDLARVVGLWTIGACAVVFMVYVVRWYFNTAWKRSEAAANAFNNPPSKYINHRVQYNLRGQQVQQQHEYLGAPSVPRGYRKY